jgi:ribosomal 30S subunit maturation factor RimM
LRFNDGRLIPFIRDAVLSVDLDAGEIQVNPDYLS